MPYSTHFSGMHDDPIAAFCAGDTYAPLNNDAANAEAALTVEELAMLARMTSDQPTNIPSQDEALFADLDRLLDTDEAGEPASIPAPEIQHVECPAPEIPMHTASRIPLPELAEMLKAKSEQIKADNERQRTERNRRRNRANRRGPEYETQRAEQRAAYAARVLEAEGRAVRSYEHITGVKTKTEREEVRKERARADQKARRAGASQDQKDADSDRKWASRQRKKGLTEAHIEAALLLRRADRERKNNPPETWGAF